MKKILLFIVFSLFTLSTAAPNVFAQEEGEAKSTSISFGVKGWYNSWLTSSLSSDAIFGDYLTALQSDPVFSYLPSVTLRHNNLFISTSYLIAPTYKFPSTTDVGQGGGFTRQVAKTKMEADRKEFDVALGYFVHPSIGLTIGYKNITQDFKSTTDWTCTPACVAQTTDSSKTTISGPTIGWVGSAAISSNMGLYGNVAYGVLTNTFVESAQKTSASYLSSEVGLAYLFSPSLSATLAYKYQDIQAGNPYNVEQDGPDVTKGLIFGINLTI